jgi:Holliday junction resolvase
VTKNSHLEEGVWKLYYDREDDRPFAELLEIISQLSNHKNVQIIRLPKNDKISMLPLNVRKILFFGRPDVIITYSDNKQNEHAVFACEVTKAAPARDHWMQRFTSSIGPCIAGVPSAIILPFEIFNQVWKGKVDSEFFYVFKRVIDFHKSPLCIVEWQAKKKGQESEDKEFTKAPDRNSKPMVHLIEFINLVIEYTIKGKNFDDLLQDKTFKIFYDDIKSKITEKPEPSGHPGRVEAMTTTKMLSWLNQQKGCENILEKSYMRKKSIILTPKKDDKKAKESLITRIDKRNGNPYNGIPLAIDYLFCRTGPSKYDRDTNLILNLSTELDYDEFMHYFRKIHDASIITKGIPSKKTISALSVTLTEGSIWSMKDVIRQFCFVSDVIVLKDCVIPFSNDFFDNIESNVTEGEIQSITRKFFQKNGFRTISRTPVGKDIHYLNSISSTNPKLKAPDLICIKNSTIIVMEEKIEHDKLFTEKSPDVDKINSFLRNVQGVTKFLELMNEFGTEFNQESIIGGFSSLSNSNSKYKVDKDKIQTVIDIDGTKCTINLVKDGGMPNLFPYKSLDMEI